MIITKKHIPRRTFLRGVGVTVALPMLESMLPAQTPIRQTAAAPVKRFVGIWHPHGVAPGYFSPVQEGPDFEFSFVTKPLESLRDRVVMMRIREPRAVPSEPGESALELWPEVVEMPGSETIDGYQHHEARRCDLRVLRHRQLAVGDEADDDQHQREDRGENRPVDEEEREAHRPTPPARGSPASPSPPLGA